MTGSKLTTASIYADYDQVIRQVEAWIKRRDPRVVGCESDQVRERLAQRLVELTSDSYADQRASRRHCLRAGDSGHLVAGGIRVCASTGRVVVSLKQYCAHVAVFVATWSRLLVVLVLCILRRAPRDNTPATVLFDPPGGTHADDAEFIRFAREGPIGVLSAATRLLITAAAPPASSVDPGRFLYVRRPLHTLIECMTTRSLRLTLLAQHMSALWVYAAALMRGRLLVLLSRDLAYLPVVRLLDGRGCIEAMVTTTSSFAVQPLWMKGFLGKRSQLHMIWYSQNFVPKMYRGDVERPDLPAARFMRADVHWVWTPGFRDYLRELGQRGDVRVVGPILWYLPPAVPRKPNRSGSLQVVLFDITPLPDGVTAFGALKNYYSVSLMRKFVADSLQCCDEVAAHLGKPVSVMLKHKRSPRPGRHAAEYLQFLKELTSTRPNFQIVEHDCNLFELIGHCELSISVPYTSTVYVAVALGKTAIYYDPEAELVANYETGAHVHFAAGRLQLCEVVMSSLRAAVADAKAPHAAR